MHHDILDWANQPTHAAQAMETDVYSQLYTQMAGDITWLTHNQALPLDSEKKGWPELWPKTLKLPKCRYLTLFQNFRVFKFRPITIWIGASPNLGLKTFGPLFRYSWIQGIILFIRIQKRIWAFQDSRIQIWSRVTHIWSFSFLEYAYISSTVCLTWIPQRNS